MRGEDLGTWMIFLVIFYAGLFLPKVTVSVLDRTGTNPPAVVANVPLGVAFFASMTSHVGDWLTRSFETVFSLPNEVRFLGGGLLFGSRVMQEARRAAIDQPVLQRDMIQFVKECVVPELINRTLDIDTLVRSTNIWGDIGAPGVLNPGRFVTYDLGANVDTCPAVYGVLKTRIAGAAAREQTRLGRLLNPHEPNPLNASALVAAQLPVVTNLLLAGSATASDTIRQNMMINLMRDSSVAIPQLLADPAAVQAALAQAQAEVTAESAFVTMAKMAESALPKIRNVVEILVIAVFPIIVLLIVAAGSKAGFVIKSYVMAFVWVQLWAPLYAVLNYVATLESAANAQAAAQGIAGWTLSTTAIIGSTLISDQAVAGMMTLAIPVIATMIVAGGAQALTSMTGTVMGPAQSSAQTAGAAAGAGNVGFGNATWETASWDNRNAHSWALSRSTTSPSRASFTDVTGTVESGAGGYGPVYTTNQGRGVVTPQMMASAGHEWSRQADRFTQIGQTQSLQAQESWRAAFQSATSFVRENAAFSRETGAYTWQDGTRMTVQQQAAAKSLDTIASDLGITDRSAASRVYQAALGAGTTEGVRLAGGVAVSNRSDQEISDAVRRVQQISRDAGLTNERSVVHAASAGGAFENGSQAGRRGGRDVRAAYDTAVAYERQASSSFSEAQALRRAASIVARDGFSITGDDTYAIHRRAEAEGISRAAMNDPGAMMDVARRYFLEKYGASLGNPPSDLDPSAAIPTADQLGAPTLSNGEAASADSVRRRSSSAQGEVSALNSVEGVAEDASPSLRDTARHFADSKRSAQMELEIRERRLSEDEQSLHGERTRRQEGKSLFVDANPGRRPDRDRQLTTQWEFFTGDGNPPDDRP
jgi:conjugal transfer mating pair stabilization protein TraG